MLGVVLCGGQSSRMGTDKGLLQSEQKIFARTAFDKLKSMGLKVIVSINSSQQDMYASFFPANAEVCDADSLSVRGPLLGIMSCHNRYPSEDLFVLACDLPLMDHGMLRQLTKRVYLFPDAAAYLFMNNGQAEPLCAIYTAKGLAHIQSRIDDGSLAKNSMKYVLEQLVVDYTEILPEQTQYFKNFNSPSDLHSPES